MNNDVPPNVACECSSQSVCVTGEYDNIDSILKGNIGIAKILHPDISFLGQLEIAYEWTIDDLFHILNSLRYFVTESYMEGLGEFNDKNE